MGDEEVPLGEGGGPTAAGATASGGMGTGPASGGMGTGLPTGVTPGSTIQDTAVQDTAAEGTAVHDSSHDVVFASPRADADPGVLHRVRSALDGDTRRKALGWVLLVAWAAWLVALWVVQPRLVPEDLLADELVQGRPTAFSVVTVTEDRTGGPFSTSSVELSPVADEDRSEALDGGLEGPQVSIAYWVDSPVADLRVVDPNGLASDVPAALVRDLTAAGVPEAPPGKLWLDPPGQRTGNAGALVALATLLIVILGPRPRRGTRWFWFWITGGPLAVGVAVFAVAELVRPRYEPVGTVHPPGVAGRWSGLAGFGIGILLSIAGTGLTIALTTLSPIWFARF